MWVRSPKFLVKLKSKSRILGDENSIPSGGGVPEGRRGSLTPMSEDGSLFISLSTPNTPSEHLRDEQLIRSVFEYDEQLDRARLSTTKTLPEPAGGGSTILPCQRTVAHLKHGGGKPEWGSPQNACILWGPRVGGGLSLPCQGDGSLFIPRARRTLRASTPRDEQHIRSVLEHDGSDEYAVFGCVRARGVILLFNSFTDMRPCAYARGAAGVR